MLSYEFFIQTEKRHIDFINKVMEAYEGLGVVRTLDPKNGLIKIISIDIYKELVERILEDLNVKGVTLKIIKQGPWEGEL